MTFDEYIDRYHLLQHTLEREHRNLGLMQRQAYVSFVARFSAAASPILRNLAKEKERLEASIHRKSRLCERYALRIARAVAQIPAGELREYARYRYVFGLTHEELAEVSFYSVRTAYRISKAAKREMAQAMLAVSPRHRRIPPAKFHVKGRLRRKDYHMGEESHRVAALTARKKSLSLAGQNAWR